tara:strand:- start:718 stop:1044 length:327 start_codon:yes stop_codon:yes gene_type:complete
MNNDEVTSNEVGCEIPESSEPSPWNDTAVTDCPTETFVALTLVAVTTPVTLTPLELIVTAAPTTALVDVVTPVTTTPSGSEGDLPDVLPLKLVTLKLDIRGLLFVIHQ